MADEKKATKDYVVVFDRLDAATGDFQSQGVGMPQVALTKTYYRGDTVSLDKETAERHLAVGAVLEANDKRAKLVEKVTPVERGIVRDATVGLGNVQLEETAPAVAGGEGARRARGGALGSAAELGKLKQTELKALAAEHGVEVTRGMSKPELVKKLAKVTVGQTDNPGQGADQSPPPPDQPEVGPDGKQTKSSDEQ